MTAASWHATLKKQNLTGNFLTKCSFLLFQMDFKDKTTREVFATVQFYYDVDVVFPKAVLKTHIASSCIVLCHQVQAIRNLAYYRCFGKSKTEVCAE